MLLNKRLLKILFEQADDIRSVVEDTDDADVAAEHDPKIDIVHRAAEAAVA